ncbi:hypothetical protein J6590_054134 [Homalodisca vitripennis]|nr:hypothetical protein J6590_054134 [Homalodisca vitripennis]
MVVRLNRYNELHKRVSEQASDRQTKWGVTVRERSFTGPPVAASLPRGRDLAIHISRPHFYDQRPRHAYNTTRHSRAAPRSLYPYFDTSLLQPAYITITAMHPRPLYSYFEIFLL